MRLLGDIRKKKHSFHINVLQQHGKKYMIQDFESGKYLSLPVTSYGYGKHNYKGLKHIVIISSPVSQFLPVNLGLQLHVYPLTTSLQVPPFRQGLLAQSSMSRIE